MGVVFCLVVSAIVGAAGSILPASARSSSPAPMLYAQKYAFLAQAREGEALTSTICSAAFGTISAVRCSSVCSPGSLSFLWSLLLFIPGIVKAYAYSMVYYVKADHPEYGWRECLDESQRLMTGHKWGEIRARSELYRLGHCRLAVPWRRHAVGHDLHGGDRSAIL